jgi:hypothetical protein
MDRERPWFWEGVGLLHCLAGYPPGQVCERIRAGAKRGAGTRSTVGLHDREEVLGAVLHPARPVLAAGGRLAGGGIAPGNVAEPYVGVLVDARTTDVGLGHDLA